MFARYAQEKSGQRLHLVEADSNTKIVSNKAICGRTCAKQGSWRMTINMPLANLCRNCIREMQFYKPIHIVEF